MRRGFHVYLLQIALLCGDMLILLMWDQGPGSKPPPTTEGYMDLGECWHWRDHKLEFSDDDTLEVVA